MSDDISFSKDGPSDDLVRQQSWPVDRAAEIEIAIEIGRVTVFLDEPGAGSGDGNGDGEHGEVRVEVRHDPDAGGGWAQGMSGFMNWLGNASSDWTGGAGFPGLDEPNRFAAQAVQAAEISWSDTGNRLVVRSAPEMPLRLVPLAVTVWAPAGARLAARAGAGDVVVTGRAGWAALRTGSGGVRVTAVVGDLDVTTGSGDVTVGTVSGRARIRTGSGSVHLDSASGPTEIKAGSGDVVLGRVAADLGARTGSGRVRIADAVSGRFDLTTGSGDVTLGVHPGVTAELDLSSGSGKARSDLEVGSGAAPQPAALRVQGRTGTGDVLVTRASVPA